MDSQVRWVSALVLGVLLVGVVMVVYDAERDQAVPEVVLSEESGDEAAPMDPVTGGDAGRDEWLRAWRENSKGFTVKGTPEEEAWYKSWADAAKAPLDTNLAPPRPKAKLRHTVQQIYRSWSRRVWQRRAKYQQKVDDVQTVSKLHVAAQVARAHLAGGIVADKEQKEELEHRAHQAQRKMERDKMATSVAEEANKAQAAAVAKAPVTPAVSAAATGEVKQEGLSSPPRRLPSRPRSSPWSRGCPPWRRRKQQQQLLHQLLHQPPLLRLQQ
jgi:hypothetical protein